MEGKILLKSYIGGIFPFVSLEMKNIWHHKTGPESFTALPMTTTKYTHAAVFLFEGKTYAPKNNKINGVYINKYKISKS